ncbi:MAG: hypothetical protein VX730_01750 [Pseudomonadota bacterium]|nr:hypothetical protein [Pseudomonadota bacterium]
MADALKENKMSSAERLESALQALESHVRSGGGMVGKNAVESAEIHDLNKSELEDLRRENAILKDKHNTLRLKLDKAITTIETVLEKQ